MNNKQKILFYLFLVILFACGHTKTSLASLNLAAGDKVSLQGIVFVLPNTLSSQYFYIYNQAGIQIYSYYKDFPKINLGDLIKVSGEVSIINGITRIKIKTSGDIEIISHDNDILPIEITTQNIIEENLGQFISLQAKVAKKLSGKLYITDEFGEGLIYLKENLNIDLNNIEVGSVIIVQGIIDKTKSSFRILPRLSDDITLLEQPNNQDKTVNKDNFVLPSRNKNKSIINFVSFFFLFCLCFYIFKINLFK